MIMAGGISSRMKQSVSDSLQLDPGLKHEAQHKSKSMITVGDSKRPFLDYLLFNARETGYEDILIIVSEQDTSVREYYGSKKTNNLYHGLRISYAVQPIPTNRSKPLGTADAVEHGLLTYSAWQGRKFTVCNSDNLYSQKALRLLLECEYSNAMIDYDRNALEFEATRVQQFSVTEKDDEGFLKNIIEKPSPADVDRAMAGSGYVGVSMNIFRLDYDMILPCLRDVPLHSTRQEKELPVAVNIMLNRHPQSVFAFPLAEHVPDLSSLHDLQNVSRSLSDCFAGFEW
jgi:NDP-sugar pyrophosphorylase family protein